MIDEYILYFGYPINIDDILLYQPTLEDLISNRFTLEMLLEPFISLDKRKFKKDNVDNVKNFDMFFVQLFTPYIEHMSKNKDNAKNINEWLNIQINGRKEDIECELVIRRLISSLKFFFRTQDVVVNVSDGILDNLDNNEIIINGSYKLNRNNYEDLKDVICEILDTEISIDDKEERSQEEDELDKLFAKKIKGYEEEFGNKKKEKNRDKLNIFTLVNYIIHNKNTQYNYLTVVKLTIYQIKNTFKYYQSQEFYDIDVLYRTSGNFKMDKKNAEHWFFDK